MKFKGEWFPGQNSILRRIRSLLPTDHDDCM